MGLLGGAFGSIFGGKIITFGRRKVTIFFNLVLFVSVWIKCIENLGALCVGRFIFGFSAGIFTCAGPKMVEETVPINLIGQFGMVSNATICFGCMVAMLVGWGLSVDTLLNSGYYWRVVFLFPIVLSFI